MISTLGNAFEGSRGKIAAAVIAAGVALGAFGGTVQAQDAPVQSAALTPGMTQSIGKPVTLRVGPGFSLSAADGIADVLNDEGCPAMVTTERGFPKRLAVEVGDSKYSFKDGEIGDAGATALSWCLDRS